MLVRISPVIVVVVVSWLLLFYTEQGNDLLASARDDVWQASRLFLTLYLLSGLAMFCTVYLLNLDPDWDTGRIFKSISVWDRKREKKNSESEKSKKDGGIDTGQAVRTSLIGLAALSTAGASSWDVFTYLMGSSIALGLFVLFLVFIGIAVVGFAVFVFIPTTPAQPFPKAWGWICGVMLLAFAAFPVHAGLLLGSEFTLFLILSLWLLLACWFAGHLSVLRLQVWPLLAAVFIVAWMLAGPINWFRETAPPATPIRCMDPHCQPPKPGPVTLEKAFDDWLARQGAKEPTLLLVSAAGGGARASYWTSIVLGRLTDSKPESVRKSLFLASGVSGGALGVAVHASLLAAESPACAEKLRPLENCARKFGTGDFLGPNVAALLTADLLNAALPRSISVPGRDVALERAWESRWQRTIGNNTLSESFLSLWRAKNGPIPNLVLNATSTRTGDRIVVSNMAAASTGASFNLAEKIDLPLSSAINASARFPFVDPPGAVRMSEKPNEPEWEVVADGGYYENFGAAAILGVLDNLERYAKEEKGTTLDKLVRPIVLQITNDPTRGMAQALDRAFHGDDYSGIENCKSRMAPVMPRGDPPSLLRRLWEQNSAKQKLELIEKRLTPGDPLEPAGIYGTLMKARTRSGSVFSCELRKRIAPLHGQYFHFAMDDSVSAPLGWALSDKARTNLDLLLDSKCHSDQFDKILAQLRD